MYIIGQKHDKLIMSLRLLSFNHFLFCLLKEKEVTPYHRVKVDFSLSHGDEMYLPNHQPIDWQFHSVEEEIRYRIHDMKYSM